MDEFHAPFHDARRQMFEAFADLLFAADRLGIDRKLRRELQDRFLDANVEIKHAYAALAFAAEVGWGRVESTEARQPCSSTPCSRSSTDPAPESGSTPVAIGA